ncbi:MAG TPA: asparagine synthase (glutamine-hydrolyzing) [Nitrososphaeraceae archaeon]|jgi:asparagine synthase (glutamine-hydrolysing)|nr:asparagine synthase (glutamine-hydrolyzing) [Nitrososphaeraceae archaeon]
MCGIVGILSKNGENVVPLVESMLSSIACRGPDGAGIAAAKQIVQTDSVGDLRKHHMANSYTALGHVRLAIVGGTCGQQPFRSCDGRFIIEHNGEIYNYKKLRNKLRKSHKFTSQTDSEVIVHIFEDNYTKSGDLHDAIKKTVSQLDGVYAIVIRDEETGEIALVRDVMGVRQLYYGENEQLLAFASEKKALWKIGLKEPTLRIHPGSALIIMPNGSFSEQPVAKNPVTNQNIRYRTLSSAIEAYKRALISSMKKRTQDFDRIGIIFSGGIDSVIIAWLAKKMVREVICYTGGVQGSSDIAFARRIAKRLDLKLRVNELTHEEVEEMIPDVMNTIEHTNAGQVEVAIPVYAAVKLAHEDGIKVMLSGQGADELFGGYSWYGKIVGEGGYVGLRHYMNEDIQLLYKETLEREDKITMAHSIEMREPFLDLKLIRLSMKIDLRLNVKGVSDVFGKHVHRKLAQNLGIPREIAYRSKEAAQHGSGIHQVFDFIARKHGFDESTVSKKYLDLLESRERVGSSQRYGYLFENEKKKMWIAEPHVQMYLDSISKTLPALEQNIITKQKSHL